MSSNSKVETPTAPEWLFKLESRREQLGRAKLGHDLDAGAPCNECVERCPGLELHFWRKICRICKCRKDQHKCLEEEQSWVQYKLLGQICSRPAYINIKFLASHPVKVEWIPPNIELDIATDYMKKLGSTRIPIVGSKAADKRKQQLAFQVPPHDLDAYLCDNLSELEKSRLSEYVQKIRNHCVGQGIVMRIGAKSNDLLVHVLVEGLPKKWAEELPKLIGNDIMLKELLSSQDLIDALTNEHPMHSLKFSIAFSNLISKNIANYQSDIISKATNGKLVGLNRRCMRSIIDNGPIYDKIFCILKAKNYDVSHDPMLGPIFILRKEFNENPSFKYEINMTTLENFNEEENTLMPSTISKEVLSLNLSLPLKNNIGIKTRQKTLLKKKQSDIISAINDCGLAAVLHYSEDSVLSQIIDSQEVKNVLHKIQERQIPQSVTITSQSFAQNFLNDNDLPQYAKQCLQQIILDKKSLLSGIINGRFYDQMLELLDHKQVTYVDCKLLSPIKQLRQKILNDVTLREQLYNYVMHFAEIGKNRNDCEFDLKSLTLNHIDDRAIPNSNSKVTSIPGVEELDLYPGCRDFYEDAYVKNDSTNIYQGPQKEIEQVNSLVCHDCLVYIKVGEIAVKTDHLGCSSTWHPECFKCNICRELLADLVYFLYNGQVYCGRDLAVKLNIPRCKACDELIFTKEYTAAENCTFHVKHFCCYNCDTPLAGLEYILDEKSNMPLCLHCYHRYIAAPCQHCNRIIGPTDQGVAWQNMHWHHTCFVCANYECGVPLVGSRFCIKQKMPFCSSDCIKMVLKK